MSEGLNYMRIVVLLGTYSSLMMQHVHHSLCKTGLNTIQLKEIIIFQSHRTMISR